MDQPKSHRIAASSDGSVVFVIDDDSSVRETLGSLIRSIGLQVKLFGSAREFMQSKLPVVPSCLVLDVRLPGTSGLDLQVELSKAGIRIPIVFITGHGDIPMSVRAMKTGAIDFLTKPFHDQDLLDAVQVAIDRDRKRREDEQVGACLRAHFATLTPRERDVMILVADGLMNKQIAGAIGISEVTVKIHRGHVMKKMGAKSLADLVRMADLLGLHPKKERSLGDE